MSVDRVTVQLTRQVKQALDTRREQESERVGYNVTYNALIAQLLAKTETPSNNE